MSLGPTAFTATKPGEAEPGAAGVPSRQELERYAAALYELLQRQLKRQRIFTPEYRAFQAKYRDHPDLFVLECFNWEPVGRPSPSRPKQGPTEYQLDGLRNLVKFRRECIRGPHGLGKTAENAWAVLWFALTRDGEDWKIPTTASAWRQLDKFLWPEIHKWAKKLKWKLIGRPPFNMRLELLGHSLKLTTGEAFATASNKPERLEGAHADHLLYIFDESKTIPAATWDAVEGAFSGQGAASESYALAASTPGEPEGRFYEIQSRRPGYEDWHVLFVDLKTVLKAGRIGQEWVDQRAKQWGDTSALYLNRVEGKFSSGKSDGIIPLAWVEAANLRWLEWHDAYERKEVELPPFTCLGSDVGGGGDASTIAHRYSWLIERIDKHSTPNTMTLVGFIRGLLEKLGGYAVIDGNGIGAGAKDRLGEMDLRAYTYNGSFASKARDHSREFGFINLRAASWWHMRELLAPESNANLALPPDDELIGDLTAPTVRRMTSAGKLQVEEKKEIRARLGRSPDMGDAVVEAFTPLESLKGPAVSVMDYFKGRYEEQQAAEKAGQEQPA